MEKMITIQLPRSHWSQIVNDLEDMCGRGREDIEILKSVKVLSEEELIEWGLDDV